MEILDEYLDNLQEKFKSPSRSTTTRSTKINRAVGQLSSIEGRKKNDPLYKQMVKYRDLYFQYKEMLHKKYKSRVINKARR